MSVSPPPKKDAARKVVVQHKEREKKIDEIINRGGSNVSKSESKEPEQIKNFNIKIMSGQLTTIDLLRTKRPRKPTSPKLGISLQDWILEAIEEKIQREKKKYAIDE